MNFVGCFPIVNWGNNWIFKWFISSNFFIQFSLFISDLEVLDYLKSRQFILSTWIIKHFLFWDLAFSHLTSFFFLSNARGKWKPKNTKMATNLKQHLRGKPNLMEAGGENREKNKGSSDSIEAMQCDRRLRIIWRCTCSEAFIFHHTNWVLAIDVLCLQLL